MASNNWIVPGAYPGNQGGGGSGTSTVLMLSATDPNSQNFGSPKLLATLTFTVGTLGTVITSGTATIFNNTSSIWDLGNYCELDGVQMSGNIAYDTIMAGASNYTLLTFAGFGNFIAGVHTITFWVTTNSAFGDLSISSYIVNAIVST